MLYYSEELDKFYKSEDEVKQAEDDARLAKIAKEKKDKELKEKREERAKEVQAALDNAQEAVAKYRKLLDQFVKDYGGYHLTVRNIPITDIFRNFWDLF